MAKHATYIIAEVGVNHNGSLTLAKELIDAAAGTGADAVKFQAFKTGRLVSARASKAEYQKRATGEGSQYEMLSRLELSADQFSELAAYSRQKGIEFLSSVFDEESLQTIVSLQVPRLKLGSGELTNGPLLDACARTGLPLIISTGMARIDEVHQSLMLLAHSYTRPTLSHSLDRWRESYQSAPGRAALEKYVTVLHCTTEYPCPLDQVDLKAMEDLRARFKLPVGYSDHTAGFHVSVAAVALGAEVIEKHFTLDCTLEGPDHRASLEPHDFRAMVSAIREVELALGEGVKRVQPAEAGNASVARRSLVAQRAISAGEQFSLSNVTVKRPGTGLSPMRLWELCAARASRSYEADEVIDLSELPD